MARNYISFPINVPRNLKRNYDPLIFLVIKLQSTQFIKKVPFYVVIK